VPALLAGMTLDDLAITMGKLGAGRWRLDVEGGETLELDLETVEVDEDRGFHAEGRSEGRETRYELTTGPQPGGPIRVRARPFADEEWTDLGHLADATKLG